LSVTLRETGEEETLGDLKEDGWISQQRDKQWDTVERKQYSKRYKKKTTNLGRKESTTP
jgi:hypothetical protein